MHFIVSVRYNGDTLVDCTENRLELLDILNEIIQPPDRAEFDAYILDWMRNHTRFTIDYGPHEITIRQRKSS